MMPNLPQVGEVIKVGRSQMEILDECPFMNYCVSHAMAVTAAGDIRLIDFTDEPSDCTDEWR